MVQFPILSSYLDRKLNNRINFVSPISVVGKSLEVDDQDLGQTPEIELLGCLLVFLTIWTIPGVVCSQLLTARVQLQTFTQFYHLQVK